MHRSRRLARSAICLLSAKLCTTNLTNHRRLRRIFDGRLTSACPAMSCAEIDAVTEMIDLGLWITRCSLGRLINLSHRHCGIQCMARCRCSRQAHLRLFALICVHLRLKPSSKPFTGAAQGLRSPVVSAKHGLPRSGEVLNANERKWLSY